MKGFRTDPFLAHCIGRPLGKVEGLWYGEEGAPLSWRPSAVADAGNGAPLSWRPSAVADAGG
jgi:hypothetical protein